MMPRAWLLFLMCGCSGAYAYGMLHGAPSRVLRVPAPVMKKGRAVGGGPAIGNGRKKRNKPVALNPAIKLQRAMERRQKAKRAQPAVSARRQAARFLAHAAASDDAAPSRVFVRPQGAAATAWREVGRVNALPGSEVHTAVRCQKRLILEHAFRLHPELRPSCSTLECGLARRVEADAESDVTVVPPADPSDARPDTATIAASCGFIGDPVPPSHYFADGDGATDPKRKVRLDGLGNDSKSAAAEAFRKTLGLRGT